MGLIFQMFLSFYAHRHEIIWNNILIEVTSIKVGFVINTIIIWSKRVRLYLLYELLTLPIWNNEWTHFVRATNAVKMSPLILFRDAWARNYGHILLLSKVNNLDRYYDKQYLRYPKICQFCRQRWSILTANEASEN